MKNFAILSTFLLLFLSCQKVEGEGGTSTIIGNIKTNDFNSDGELVSTYPAADEDVFIIYGTGGTSYDDKTTTSFDGSFKFPYLTEGDYTIFIYSDCDSCSSGEEVVLKSVIVSNKDEIVNIGELLNND